MTFESPIALLALLAIPVLIGLFVLRERRRTAFASRFANPALLPNVVDRSPGRLRYLPFVVLIVALAALVVGVARPHAVVSVPREEATIVIAVDTSRSMKAKDIPPTRLGAARLAAKLFVDRVPEKFRIGVVSFGTRATVATPPTEDRAIVDEALDTLTPGDGTAIGDAVALSARMGRRERRPGDPPPPPRSVLLISDGAADGGTVTPQRAAERARQLRVPVYTVVLGTQQGVVEEELTGGLRRIIRVPPNPDTLRMIADTTRGTFFTAAGEEELREVYEELGSRLGTRKEEREITDFFAGGSAVLLLAGGVLSAFWLRRVV
jgi:Ca-activated chloride channel family protein